MCTSPGLVILRRQYPQVLATMRLLAQNGSNGSGDGSDIGRGNGSGNGDDQDRRTILVFGDKHISNRWNIWRALNHSNHCVECGKPLKSIPASASMSTGSVIYLCSVERKTKFHSTQYNKQITKLENKCNLKHKVGISTSKYNARNTLYLKTLSNRKALARTKRHFFKNLWVILDIPSLFNWFLKFLVLNQYHIYIYISRIIIYSSMSYQPTFR